MAEEIQEAVQIIRVAYEGIEIAMKIGSGGFNAAKKALDLLIGLIDYEKSIGKVNMRKLLMKGGDLQVFQFDKADQKKVMKMLKKYGILYSVLPNINKEKGKMEIVFHSEAVPRMNMLIQKLQTGRIATFDEYLREDGGKNAAELTKFLENEKKKGNSLTHTEGDKAVDNALDGLIEKVGNFAMDKESISVAEVKENFSVNQEQAQDVISKLATMGVLAQNNDATAYKVLMDREAFQNRVRSYRSLADRMKAVSKSKDTSLADITISKNLIAEENEIAIKTRVPGTWGDDVRYLWVRKENAMEIHGGKTVLTFLDKDKDYKLYDAENRVVEMKKGKDLYSSHYDTVEIGLRQKLEKARRDKEKREKQIQDAIKKLSAGNTGRKK